MDGSLLRFADVNAVTIVLALVVIGSAIQGLFRGASGSARHFVRFIAEGLITVVALLISWKATEALSAAMENWLKGLNISIPQGPLDTIQQLYYTFITGTRDFSLFRFGVLFLFVYPAVKQVLYWATDWIWHHGYAVSRSAEKSAGTSVISGAAGAAIGLVLGSARALMLIAALFVYTSWFPQAPFAGYIQTSGLYQQGATQIIEPITGGFVDRLPVFTRAVENEISKILERRYEVIDAQVPDDIASAARQVTAAAKSDEEKARLLYKWVGTRVKYDWEKVRLYEEENKWKEQSPEYTFEQRVGVCIDYARLYAVMARSVDLQVKVVTGLGYDGRGGYGPHAWNEVYMADRQEWIPLDPTWVASGGNWFNPPDFDKTHIRGATAA